MFCVGKKAWLEASWREDLVFATRPREVSWHLDLVFWTCQGAWGFLFGVLKKFRRDDEEVELVKWILDVMCLHRLNFGYKRCQ